MKRPLVLVVDSYRGRIFELERDAETDSNRLIEVSCLVQPERRVNASDKFANSRPGLRREWSGGPRHGVDDRRDANVVEHDRQFARTIVHELADQWSTGRRRGLVVAASPHMLGVLRPELERAVGPSQRVRELDVNIAHLSAVEIHDYLASQHLVAPR